MADKVPTSKARLFDIRRVIGGLFVLYGVVLTVTGLLDGPAEIRKAAGVHINVWTGLALLVLGAIFLVWQWLRPVRTPSDDPEEFAGS